MMNAFLPARRLFDIFCSRLNPLFEEYGSCFCAIVKISNNLPNYKLAVRMVLLLRSFDQQSRVIMHLELQIWLATTCYFSFKW